MAKQNKYEFPIVEGIHILSIIGRGHFSRVYKAVELKEKGTVAVKVIDKNDLNKNKADVIISEIGIMKSLNHPHIVRMKDFKWDSKSVYIILEYCEGGNLYEYIKLKNRLKESICKRALQQLASGLAYLRSKNICHMDLKPQNILIKFNPFTVKIADFGLAQYLPEKNYKDNLRGSPLYMAPEILLNSKYNSKVDLWSVGIILYECLYGKAPLAHKNLSELLDCVKNEVPLKYPSTISVSKECKDLIEKLLTYNPDKRISYDDFFNHPFIDLVHAPTEENKNLAFKIISEAVKLDEKKEYFKAFTAYCRALRYLIPILETVTGYEDRAYLQLKITEYLHRAEELKSVLFKDKYNSEVRQFASEDHKNLQDVEKLVSSGSTNISSLIHSGSVNDENCLVYSSYSANQTLSSNDNLSGPNTQSYISESEFIVPNEQTSSSHSSSKDSSCSTIKSFLDEMTSSQHIRDTFANSSKIQSALEIGFSGQMYIIQGDYDLAYSKYETALSILIKEAKDFPPGPKRDYLLFQIKKWLSDAESAKTLASAKSINLAENIKSGVEVLDKNCSLQ